MGFIRVLSARYHFDATLQRFQDLAFKNTGGAISVFMEDCAIERSGTICAHIRAFYLGQTQEPPTFIRVAQDLLPEGALIEPEVSKSDDECHVGIHGLKDRQAEKFFKRTFKYPSDVRICENGTDRALTSEDRFTFPLPPLPNNAGAALAQHP